MLLKDGRVREKEGGKGRVRELGERGREGQSEGARRKREGMLEDGWGE